MLNTDLHRLHRSETCDGESVPDATSGGGAGLSAAGVDRCDFFDSAGAERGCAHGWRMSCGGSARWRRCTGATQYVRAIEVYYLKIGHYPGSIEQLEKTNNIRFLRQRYVDPMTGKDDWRLIQVGEAKTTVKGFFGQPLAGLRVRGWEARREWLRREEPARRSGTSSPGSSGSRFGLEFERARGSSWVVVGDERVRRPAGSLGASGTPGTAGTTGIERDSAVSRAAI